MDTKEDKRKMKMILATLGATILVSKFKFRLANKIFIFVRVDIKVIFICKVYSRCVIFIDKVLHKFDIYIP